MNQPKLAQQFNNEITKALTALVFLTRIPIHRFIQLPYSTDILSQSSRYFPLAGLIIGTLCALVFIAATQLFSPTVSLAISMVFSLLLTGAFHEDGLADSADAFGGGWQQEDVLKIMKDSRLGTYGVAALTSSLALKFLTLNEMTSTQVCLALITGHTLSRALSVSYLYDLNYVQDIDSSKSKPLATQMDKASLTLALAIGISPALFWLGLKFIIVLVVLAFVRMMWGSYLLKRINGYTGDTLGAAQQLFEISFYLCLLGVL